MSPASGPPGPADGRSGRMPYMIGGDPATLAEIARALGGTVQRAVGPPDRPTLLVAEMTQAQAQDLQGKYGSAVTIEPDQPVELY